MVAAGELGEIRAGAGRVRAGLADRAARGDRAEAGATGAPIRRARAPADASATSARMPSSSRISSPALQPQSLLADLSTFVPGRRVDDNAQMLLRYANGARGALWASQVAPGNENNLALRVYGAKGGHRMAPGASEPARLDAVRRADADRHARHRRGERGRRARHAHSGRPSGRLSRSLRDDLCGSRRRRSMARRSGAALDAAVMFPGDRRRRRGRRVHRGGDPVEPRRRGVGLPRHGVSSATRHRCRAGST